MKKRHPFWTTLGVIFLVLIIAGGVTALCGYFLGWYENTEEDRGTRDSTDIEGQGLVVTTYALTEDQYEEYGVNPLASSAYTLTVTFEGTVFDRSLTWELSWDNSYTGNDDVTDYVELSAYTGEEVVLSCLQPFAYNIYVNVYRTSYPDTYATCKLDYLSSCEVTCNLSVDWLENWWVCTSSSSFIDDFTYSVVYGTGTIQYEVTSFSLDYFFGFFESSTSYISYSALVDVADFLSVSLNNYNYDLDSEEVLIYDCYGVSNRSSNLDFDSSSLSFNSLMLSNGDPNYGIDLGYSFSSMEEFTFIIDQSGHLNDFYFTWMSYLYNGERQFVKLYIPLSYDDTQASLSLNEGNVIFGNF